MDFNLVKAKPPRVARSASWGVSRYTPLFRQVPVQICLRFWSRRTIVRPFVLIVVISAMCDCCCCNWVVIAQVLCGISSFYILLSLLNLHILAFGVFFRLLIASTAKLGRISLSQWLTTGCSSCRSCGSRVRDMVPWLVNCFCRYSCNLRSCLG